MNTQKPKLIYPDWKCKKLCHFGKTNLAGDKVNDFKDTSCSTIKNELSQLGMDKVLKKHSKDPTYNNYGDGGGRYNGK